MIRRDEVFPFRIVVDENLTIIEVGSSLRRMNAQIVLGVSLPEMCSLVRPQIGFTFEQLSQYTNKLIFLQMLDRPVKMRGQFVRIENELIFVGSPWLESMEDLEANNLRIHDIAPHDATLETVLLRTDQADQVHDLKGLVDSLRAESKEKDRLSVAEESLAHDLNSAGDLLIRMTQYGELLEVRAPSSMPLPLAIEELRGHSISELIPECAQSWQSIVYELTHGKQVVRFAFSLGEHATSFEARIAFTLNNDLLLLARDVTEQKRLQDQLQHQASHDSLTDLPNRAVFEKGVAQALDDDNGASILFIDLDDFKSINDHQGHQAGDRLLVQVARDLRDAVRGTDMAARLGGDEFGVLLPTVESVKQAEVVAARILRHLQRPADGPDGPREFSIKASIGVATSETSPTAEAIFRDADIAMYRAKESDERKIVVFEKEMYVNLCERRAARDELSAGLKRSEIINHYQPIVRLDDGSICAMEALARWEHPTRGLLTPYHFIEIAEASGSIVELGRQVLFKACHDAKHYCENAGNEVSVNVNISAIQVRRDDFGDLVRAALDDSGLRPDLLTLEITESVLFADFENATRVFAALQDLGVNVALDDFGAGHSSLKYLKQFPVDILKLDRSLISDTGASTLPLLNAVIDMGRALNLTIVAEGIETPAQNSLLKTLGCHLAQGYFYSRPVAMKTLLNQVQKQ
ncbi:MAG: putative bifunctional diguanylate cyclase/phosphodiesterase [Planctomycetaceae bacterium]